jgi:hypothetical protein
MENLVRLIILRDSTNASEVSRLVASKRLQLVPDSKPHFIDTTDQNLVQNSSFLKFKIKNNVNNRILITKKLYTLL